MAERGQRIEGYDSAIEFVETTAESDGERVVIEISYQGSGIKPPAHFHPNQTEHFEVLEGEIHVDLDGEERTVTAGETIDLPPGTTHQMWCDVPSRQRWTTAPALKTERFFETMWGLQQDGKAGGPTPSLPQTALRSSLLGRVPPCESARPASGSADDAPGRARQARRAGRRIQTGDVT